MRKRTIVTVLLGVGVGLGWLMSLILPDLGAWGIGLGRPALSTNQSESSSTEPPPPESESGTASNTESHANSRLEPVVYVLIDGRDFLLRTSGGERPQYRPTTVEEIVEMTQTAVGDEDGLRLRISRKATARATAEQQLRDALQQGAVNPEAVRWDEDPVP